MTADTYSATLGYLTMGTGNDNNTWGANANAAVFQILEDAIANALTNAVTGGTLDLSGSPPPAAASQARYAALIFTGVLGSNQVVQVPNLQKFWWVKNATSGSFTLKIKTPAGTASTAIPQNSGWQRVYCDGANAIVVDPFNSVQIQIGDGSAAAPAYSWLNATATGWYRAGTQDYRFSMNGTDVLQLTGPAASTPSVLNVLSPTVLQQAGAQIIPPGTEICGAFVALPAGGWLWEDGTAYLRASYTALFSAITATCTGNTHASTTIDNLSSDLRGLGLVGAQIEGTGITLGTTIVSIAATSMVVSSAVAGSNVGITLRILPWGQGDGSTTFTVPDRRSRALYGRATLGNTTDPARITIADTSKLNTTFGVDSVTMARANLPDVVLPVSVISGAISAVINGVGTSPSGSTFLTRADNTNNAVTYAVSLSDTRVWQAQSMNGAVTQTAMNTLSPGGVTNMCIKT